MFKNKLLLSSVCFFVLGLVISLASDEVRANAAGHTLMAVGAGLSVADDVKYKRSVTSLIFGTAFTTIIALTAVIFWIVAFK